MFEAACYVTVQGRMASALAGKLTLNQHGVMPVPVRHTSALRRLQLSRTAPVFRQNLSSRPLKRCHSALEGRVSEVTRSAGTTVSTVDASTCNMHPVESPGVNPSCSYAVNLPQRAVLPVPIVQNVSVQCGHPRICTQATASASLNNLGRVQAGQAFAADLDTVPETLQLEQAALVSQKLLDASDAQLQPGRTASTGNPSWDQWLLYIRRYFQDLTAGSVPRVHIGHDWSAVTRASSVPGTIP
jgi:hypothetical protein